MVTSNGMPRFPRLRHLFAGVAGLAFLLASAQSGDAEVVFQDNFNRVDSLSLGAPWTVLTGTMLRVSDERATAPLPHQIEDAVIVLGLNLAQQTIDVDWTPTGVTTCSGVDGRLLARVRNSSNYYGARIAQGVATDDLILFKVLAGTYHQISRIAFARITAYPFHLRLSATGASLEFRVYRRGSDEIVLTGTDPDLTSGSIGLVAYSYGGDCPPQERSTYDNLVVESSDSSLACGTTLPFGWPTSSNAGQVSQDYAEFNSSGTKRPDHYHTGMDLASPTWGAPQEVFAAGKGEVVAVCPNEPGGCEFGGLRFSRADTIDNHGLQGVVILKHTLSGSGTAYSLYGHLGAVEAFLPGECIEQGTRVGVTGGLPDAHLHFEVKSEPVLHNPVGVIGTCIDPFTHEPAGVCFGYTLVNPNTRGYHDPVEYLHLPDKSGFPKAVTLSDEKNKKVKKINVRSGPGELLEGAYRVTGKAEEGPFIALSKVSETTANPHCTAGWYQIQRASNDCSALGNCFTFNDESTQDSVPEAWVCGDFLRE